MKFFTNYRHKIFEVLGVACLVAAAFMLNTNLGVAVTGLGCLNFALRS